MRLVIDCRCVFAGCGGIGSYTRSLVTALQAINRQDEFIFLRTAHRAGGPLARAAQAREVAVPAAMLDPDWEQLQLPLLLAELGADLYHNPTFALPVVAPCPLVTTIHDVVFAERPELVAPGLREYLARWSALAARLAARVITVSEHSRQAIGRAYGVPPERITVTHEAADLERFQPRCRLALETEFRRRYDLDRPFILYVGSLEPKKNLDRLLVAFARARREAHLPHQLVLAGGRGGLDYDAAEAVGAYGLAGHVVITGFLPDPYLPVAYNAAELFIYPSLYEGFGLPPLEAMACGTPTIVADATSLPEVVGDGALLVDPASVEALSAALTRVATDEVLRAQLAAGGLARARQFSWQATALDTMSAYRQAAA